MEGWKTTKTYKHRKDAKEMFNKVAVQAHSESWFKLGLSLRLRVVGSDLEGGVWAGGLHPWWASATVSLSHTWSSTLWFFYWLYMWLCVFTILCCRSILGTNLVLDVDYVCLLLDIDPSRGWEGSGWSIVSIWADASDQLYLFYLWDLKDVF